MPLSKSAMPLYQMSCFIPARSRINPSDTPPSSQTTAVQPPYPGTRTTQSAVAPSQSPRPLSAPPTPRPPATPHFVSDVLPLLEHAILTELANASASIISPSSSLIVNDTVTTPKSHPRYGRIENVSALVDLKPRP
jgi:hypothetical protein